MEISIFWGVGVSVCGVGGGGGGGGGWGWVVVGGGGGFFLGKQFENGPREGEHPQIFPLTSQILILWARNF